MHPDGAVNFIVEYACQKQKNFVIVPCCVFGKVYERTLNDGEKVIEREQLITWIEEECKRQGFVLCF